MLRKEDSVLSEKKLKKIMKEVLDEYFDPDYGMKIKKEFSEILKKSKSEEERGELFPLEDIKKEIE